MIVLQHKDKNKLVDITIGGESIQLSEWEVEAIRLVASGLTHKDVARKLDGVRGAETNKAQMRLFRLRDKLAEKVGYSATATVCSVLCRAAYMGGIIKL